MPLGGHCNYCDSPIGTWVVQKVRDYKQNSGHFVTKPIPYNPLDCSNALNRGYRHMCSKCKDCGARIIHVGSFVDNGGYWATLNSQQEMPHRCRENTHNKFRPEGEPTYHFEEFGEVIEAVVKEEQGKQQQQELKIEPESKPESAQPTKPKLSCLGF